MPIALCSYFYDAVTGGHLPLDYMIHVRRHEKILLLYAAFACEDYDGDTGSDDGNDDDKLQRQGDKKILDCLHTWGSPVL